MRKPHYFFPVAHILPWVAKIYFESLVQLTNVFFFFEQYKQPIFKDVSKHLGKQRSRHWTNYIYFAQSIFASLFRIEQFKELTSLLHIILSFSYMMWSVSLAGLVADLPVGLAMCLAFHFYGCSEVWNLSQQPPSWLWGSMKMLCFFFSFTIFFSFLPVRLTECLCSFMQLILVLVALLDRLWLCQPPLFSECSSYPVVISGGLCWYVLSFQRLMDSHFFLLHTYEFPYCSSVLLILLVL